MYRVIINEDMVYSCGEDRKVMAWTTANNQLKYDFNHDNAVYDIVIGREGTPLAGRLLTISWDKSCRVSNLETGAEVRRINFDDPCYSITVDEAQTLIAVGTAKKVTFIETTNFSKIKEVSMNDWVCSLAFNKRNDCMLAVTKSGEVYSFKF